MPQMEACLFSPFSPNLVRQENHRVLLLQFFLKELLEANRALRVGAPAHVIISLERRHFPYDWAKESGHVNKAKEHAELLRTGFDFFQDQLAQIHSILNGLVSQFASKDVLSTQNALQIKKKLHQLYLLIEPLLLHFKKNENLIFFLLKNQGLINALMGKGHLREFLSRLHKKGMVQLEKNLCDHYHNRGFSSLIPELKRELQSCFAQKT